MKNKKIKVLIIESEAGWGQKVDEERYFNTKKEAHAFVKKYNKINDKDSVPSWYMYAVLEEDRIKRI